VVFYLIVPIVVFAYPARAKLTNSRLAITIIGGLGVAVLLQVVFSKYLSSVYAYANVNTTPDFNSFFDYLKVFTYNNVSVRANSTLFVVYLLCFLMGILIAAKDFGVRYAWLFLVSGVLLIPIEHLYPPIIHSAYGLIFAAVIIFAFNVRSFRSMLDTPFMLWLGERSYSLFLVHFSVFYLVDNMVARFTTERGALYAILTRGLGWPLALFAAMLLFNFVEKKFARGLVTGEMFWPWQTGALKKLVRE